MCQPRAQPPASLPPYGMLAVLWLVGWTLRVPILAAPPLATRMANSFDLGTAGVGALTMLPVIAVAFGAVPAAWIIARFGVRAAIVGGLVVTVAASVARAQVSSAMLLFGVSAVMGLGVAVYQTALPAATRAWTPTHIALGSAVYLNGMMLGELSGAGLTLPFIVPLAGGDWRLALVLWAIPVLLITLLVLLVRLPKVPADSGGIGPPSLFCRSSFPNWNDCCMWQYGLLLGSSVVAFFVVNAYAGALLVARSEADALKAVLFAYNVMPLLASFLVVLFPKWIGFRQPVVVSALFAVIGLAGFAVFDGWLSWLSALVVGFAATVELILLVSLPPVIATGIAITRLSAGMTLIGFGVAFLLSLLGGWLADRTGSVELTLIPALCFMLLAFAACGRFVRYPVYK